MRVAVHYHSNASYLRRFNLAALDLAARSTSYSECVLAHIRSKAKLMGATVARAFGGICALICTLARLPLKLTWLAPSGAAQLLVPLPASHASISDFMKRQREPTCSAGKPASIRLDSPLRLTRR